MRKEYLYTVGMKSKQTGERINLKVWAETVEEATYKIVEVMGGVYGEYTWTGSGPLYENNEVIEREVKKEEKKRTTKKYLLTVERSYRMGLEFEASSNEEAEAKAAELAEDIGDEIFAGSCESDYALCDENGRMIIDWE